MVLATLSKQIVFFRPSRCFPPRRGRIQFAGDGFRIKLEQGSNELSPQEVQDLRSHPDFEQYSKWQAIEISQPKEEIVSAAPVASVDLSIYNVDEAEEIVEQTHAVKTLELWLEKESRVTLRKAINKRITAIKEGKE